jgi:hypothetical protein
MKKSILTLGKTLTRAEQKQVHGGDICSVVGVQCFSEGCNSQNCNERDHACICNVCVDLTVFFDPSYFEQCS